MLVSALIMASKALNTLATDQGEGWIEGRATFYGGPGDGASINGGSCLYYSLSYGNNGQGYFITALSDTDPDFSGRCGRCYEVACVPGVVTDGYGNQMDRSNACTDPNKSVFVKVTDSCPCYYPANAYSNRRWCCGDSGVRHMDMSYLAFQQLSPMSNGVMRTKFRPVSCDLWSAANGQAAPINPAGPWNGSDSSSSSASIAPVSSSDSSSSSSAVSAGGSTVVLSGSSGPTSGWHDSSWSLQNTWTASSGSKCYSVNPNGAFSLSASSQGALAGVDALHYELDQSLSTPDAFRVQLLGSGGSTVAEQSLSLGGSWGYFGLGDASRRSDCQGVAFVNRNSSPATLCLKQVSFSASKR